MIIGLYKVWYCDIHYIWYIIQLF